jgi:hypothetical protein
MGVRGEPTCYTEIKGKLTSFLCLIWLHPKPRPSPQLTRIHNPHLLREIKERAGREGGLVGLFFLSRAAGSRVRREAALPPPNLDGAAVLLPPNLDAAAVFPSPNPGAKIADSPPPICRPTSSGAVSCLGQPASNAKFFFF